MLMRHMLTSGFPYSRTRTLTRAHALTAEGRMTVFEGSMKDILPDIDACEFPHCHSVDDTVFAVNTPDASLC